MCLCCKSCVSNFLKSPRSSQYDISNLFSYRVNSLVLFAFFYFIIIGLVFFFLPVLNISTSQCDAIIIITAVIDVINAIYLYYIFWLLKQSLIANLNEDGYNNTLYVKINHLIRTNHIVFSHPILLAIAFIWVCVSMKIADSFVVETTLIAQFVLNLIGFVHSGLLLYIIPYLCGRNHCKNDNTSVDRNANCSNNIIFNNTTQPTLYTSVPKTSPVQGIRVNEQSSYYISQQQQQQQNITIIPITASNVVDNNNISTTTDKKEKIELPSYKEKLLITPTVINNSDSDSSGEEEEIILPNKSDYILPQSNNVPPLIDISNLQYDNDDDNSLNSSSQRPLSTIIEVNEDSNTPHPLVSIQFINETQKLFAKAANVNNNNSDTKSEVNLPQPSPPTTAPVLPPRQIYNISFNNDEQFKSQSETFSLQDQNSNKHNQFMESSSYSYAHSTHYNKRSTGTNIGLFVMPSESTLLSNTSLLRNSSIDSLSSDASFMFNPPLRQPSYYPIRDNASQHSNPSFPLDIAPSASNYEDIAEENESQPSPSPSPLVETYTSDVVTPGGYIEELPVDPQTLHFNMEDIDPVARDRILRGFVERKKRKEFKHEDDD